MYQILILFITFFKITDKIDSEIKFKNMFLKSFIILILSLFAGSTHHDLFNKQHFNHYQQKITDSEFTYACVKSAEADELQKCQKFREFTISHNISYSCYDEYLPIHFEIDIMLQNGSITKSSSYGFLSPQQGLSIFAKQSSTNFCKNIKK